MQAVRYETYYQNLRKFHHEQFVTQLGVRIRRGDKRRERVMMDSGDFILPSIDGIEFVNYTNEEQLDDVMRLVSQDLSEPYSSKF